jgi:hypothetical protein
VSHKCATRYNERRFVGKRLAVDIAGIIAATAVVAALIFAALELKAERAVNGITVYHAAKSTSTTWRSTPRKPGNKQGQPTWP